MNNAVNQSSAEFGLTLQQRLWHLLIPLALSAVIMLLGDVFQSTLGIVLFLLLGAALGIVTFFISAGWGFKIAFTQNAILIGDKGRKITVPLDRIGLVVKNGGIPFPQLLLVLRNAEVGNELPKKGVDPQARELIDSYLKRNPGKKLTVVPINGGYLRSIHGFALEVRRRIPPVTVDERLLK